MCLCADVLIGKTYIFYAPICILHKKLSMKTLLLLLSLAMGLVVNAQLVELPLCSVDSQYILPGLYPSYDSLPCFEKGTCTQASVQFVNLDSFVHNGIAAKVEDFTITGVANLPCGIKYESESIYFGQPYPITNQGNTCLWLGGVTTDSVGLYKITIFGNATITSSALPQPVVVALNLNDYGYKLYLRVVDSASTICLAVDTAASTLVASCASGLASCTLDEFGTYCDTCGIISSIVEIGEIEAFQLYPNPTSSSVTVSFKTSKSNLVRWQILNMFGQVVNHATLNAIAGLNKETVDVSALTNGIYLIVVDDGIHQQTQRFVVVR